MVGPVRRRRDGKYEEHLGDDWTAEYSEDPGNDLWRVEIFKHDVPEWLSTDYISLEEAQQAAYERFRQR